MAKALDERARQRAAAVLDRSTGGRVPLGPGSRPTGIGRAGFGLGAALVAALTLASCAGDSTAAGPAATTELPASTTSTTAAPPPTTVSSLAQQAELGYSEYRTAMLEANNPPDPTSQGLREVAVGLALERAVDSVSDNRDTGRYLELPNPSLLRAELISVRETPDGLAADFCLVDGVRVRAQSSDRVLNDRVVSSRVRVSFEPMGGETPRVARVEYLSRLEGEVPCV